MLSQNADDEVVACDSHFNRSKAEGPHIFDEKNSDLCQRFHSRRVLWNGRLLFAKVQNRDATRSQPYINKRVELSSRDTTILTIG